MHLNTSHVTVYQHYQLNIDQELSNLNTSHVTVYRANQSKEIKNLSEFKYISCYGLSLTG